MMSGELGKYHDDDDNDDKDNVDKQSVSNQHPQPFSQPAN